MPRRMNPAQKRYVRRVFVAMACYMVTLSIALHYVGKGHLANRAIGKGDLEHFGHGESH